jgi:endonuclease YncB( thermonuclease family)
MLSKLCVIAFAICFASPAFAETIIGQASVIDGDTIEIHGQRIRLSGIDAPESDQLCRGDDSLQYRCGAKAANALDDHIAGRPVSCEGIGTDQYGRVVAVCSVDGEDVGGCLVGLGICEVASPLRPTRPSNSPAAHGGPTHCPQQMVICHRLRDACKWHAKATTSPNPHPSH